MSIMAYVLLALSTLKLTRAFAGRCQVRVGVCSGSTTATLAACHVQSKPPPSDGILPTKLYCKNRAVDDENRSFLAALPGAERCFASRDTIKGEPAAEVQQRLLEAVEKKAAASLPLKVGAQVLLLIQNTHGPLSFCVTGHVKCVGM